MTEENDGTYLCPLIDHTSVARHYLIKSTSHPDTIGGPSPEGIFDDRKHGIRRQFTECFSMRKDIYEALCHIGQNMDNCAKEVEIVKKGIAQFNQNGTCLSIKSYEGCTGLSKFLFDHCETSKHIYECKGPMGSGLACNQTGKHIAYTAGTGILVFLDLCAYLLIRLCDKYGNTGIYFQNENELANPRTSGTPSYGQAAGGIRNALNNSERTANSRTMGSSYSQSSMDQTRFNNKPHRIHGSNEPLDLDNFTFELHTSFASEEEAMGLELVDILVELCEKFGMQNLFIHYCRISKVKKGEKVRQPVGKRMDENAYREDFVKMEAAGNVETIYVCGPPIMQEHFDRA